MEYTPITGPGSVSRISTYEKCPHKAFLKYKAELPKFKVSGKSNWEPCGYDDPDAHFRICCDLDLKNSDTATKDSVQSKLTAFIKSTGKPARVQGM